VSKMSELGWFGNIWVRQNVLLSKGDAYAGHIHKFDHVTLLVSGKVLVEVDGQIQKEFTAPTFIVIRKEHKHKITALEMKINSLTNKSGEEITIQKMLNHLSKMQGYTLTLYNTTVSQYFELIDTLQKQK